MKKCYKTLRKQVKILSKSFMGKSKMTEKQLNYFHIAHKSGNDIFATKNS